MFAKVLNVNDSDFSFEEEKKFFNAVKSKSIDIVFEPPPLALGHTNTLHRASNKMDTTQSIKECYAEQ
jgi:DNA modification methylase